MGNKKIKTKEWYRARIFDFCQNTSFYESNDINGTDLMFDAILEMLKKMRLKQLKELLAKAKADYPEYKEDITGQEE